MENMLFLFVVLSVIIAETETSLSQYLVHISHLCISEMKHVIRANICRKIVRSGKCHSGNCASRKYLFGELPLKSRNRALENFLWATVSHGNVRKGTAPLCKCFIRIFNFLRRTCQLHLIQYNIFNILIMLVAFIRVSLLRLLC